ncbi:MAG: thymidine phosphorylase [Anaerolineae bacterium]|nr:thymidine phosphorylase [Anaerolineae bacterium]
MRAQDIIVKKRDGFPLSKEEIDFFIQEFTRGEIPDYQAAAWLMAVYLQGMSKEETIYLTNAMARSGRMLDLKGVAPFVVDKHSTGGVGDKTTLVVAPLVSACGVPVGKISGRGLGFTGGTLDKLESFPGFTSQLDVDRFLSNLARYGIVVAGQTEELAPADGMLYALRDVTATVGSIPLIASSIMSKKLAAGADGIVLDVKVGRGAFMKTVEDAIRLAQAMVEIGEGVGRRVSAVISDMSQPLGFAVGNALEVREAIDTLQGSGPPDFWDHCLVIATQMLMLTGSYDEVRAQEDLGAALQAGGGLKKLKDLVVAQGGDPAPIDDPMLLPQAPIQHPVTAPRRGYIAAVDAQEVGMAAMRLGAGRTKKGEPIDHGVGIVLHRKIGDHVEEGEEILTVHARSEEAAQEAESRLLSAYLWSEEPIEPPPLIHRLIPWSGR